MIKLDWVTTYSVVVGNIGTVYEGTDRDEAEKRFNSYLLQSQSGRGRAGNEDVTLMADDEPIKEHFGNEWDEEEWNEEEN